MLRRIMLLAVLCVSLCVLLEVEAMARCRVLGGSLLCSDPCAYTYLAGMGNVDKTPTSVCVALYPDQGEAGCWNKPGNSSVGQGIPFTPATIDAVVSETPVFWYDVTKNGTASVPICFEWDQLNAPLELYAQTFPDLVGLDCPNDNWYIDAHVTHFFAVHIVKYTTDTKSGSIDTYLPLCRDCTFMSADTEVGECGFNCLDVDCNTIYYQFPTTYYDDALIQCGFAAPY